MGRGNWGEGSGKRGVVVGSGIGEGEKAEGRGEVEGGEGVKTKGRN